MSKDLSNQLPSHLPPEDLPRAHLSSSAQEEEEDSEDDLTDFMRTDAWGMSSAIYSETHRKTCRKNIERV